jgi:ribosomal protein L32
MQAEEEEKEPEKIWEPLVWTKRVEDWKELAVCSHCGHSTYDLRASRVCPKCGCKDSRESKVVRREWEETYCEHDHPEFVSDLIDYNFFFTPRSPWRLIRNKKLVTWTGCSANEEAK